MGRLALATSMPFSPGIGPFHSSCREVYLPSTIVDEASQFG